MTQKEILEFNKLCAEFLGKCGKHNKHLYRINIEGVEWLTLEEMKFHSDWNWIIEVKNEICQLDIVDEFNTQYNSISKGYNCNIRPAYKDSFASLYSQVYNREKAAVIFVINQFLIWYNESK